MVLDEENGPMKQLKFSEEQIVYILRQTNSGTPSATSADSSG